MPLTELKKLFGDERLGLLLERREALQKKVGAGPFDPDPKGRLALEGSRAFPVLGESVRVGGKLGAHLEILGADERIELYEGDPPAAAPAGHAFTVLTVEAGVEAGGAGRLPTPGSGRLSISGGVRRELTYQHVLAVKNSKSRRSALAAVVRGARLPVLIRPGELKRIGEGHRLTGLFHLDLGADFQIGFDREIATDLFREIDSPARFDVEAAFSASFGLSIHDEMTLDVGTLGVRNPGWVRARLSRENERRLTLGALFKLQVEYELGDALVAILEHGLEHSPFPRIQAALEELSLHVKKVETADWEKLKERLTDDAQETLTKFLGIPDLLDRIAESDEAQRLVELSLRTIRAYGKLDDAVASLWGRALERTELGAGSPFRAQLVRVAALKQQSAAVAIQKLLGDDGRDILDLVESLGSDSLENLLLGNDGSVKKAIDRAAGLAQQALDFIAETPGEIVERIQIFSKKHGIDAAVKFLQANTSSTAQLRKKLEQKSNRSIRKLVEKVLGKAFDLVDADDVRKVKGFAGELRAKLDRAASIDERLKAKLAQLDGQFGFSVGLELDRMTRSTQLVDIEFDPKNGTAERAFKTLAAGDGKQFLAELPEPEEDENPPYLIRECLFTSKRVRASAFNLFFSFLSGVSRRRVMESSIRVENGKRTGTHSGSFFATVSLDKVPWTAGVRLSAEGRSARVDPAAAYENGVDRSLRLTVSRQDSKTSARELQATQGLLRNLGFTDEPALQLAGVPEGRPTRLSVELEFDGGAADKLLSGLPNASAARTDRKLDADYLRAANLWYADATVDERVAGRDWGTVLSHIVRSKSFAAKWRSGRLDAATFTLSPGTPNELVVRPHQARARTLVALASARGNGGRSLSRAAERLRIAKRSDRPDDLDRLMRRFARACGRSTPTAKLWRSPMFPVWLVLSRLGRMDAAIFAGARGVATFRWKEDPQGPWSDPLLFRLAGLRRPVQPVRM